MEGSPPPVAVPPERSAQRPGVTRIEIDGRILHAPRVLLDPVADWVAELAELPTDCGDADALKLEPRKLGDVCVISNEAIEDSAVGQLDAVGQMLTRGSIAPFVTSLAGHQDLSPLEWAYGYEPLEHGLDWGKLALLVGFGVVLAVAGALRFERRDVRT